MKRLLLSITLVLLIVGCREASQPVAPIEESKDLRVLYHMEALPAHPTYPADNPKDRDRFVLGWRLFYDPVLSATKDVACGTCHHARFAMSDGRERSIGVFGEGLGPDRVEMDQHFTETPRNSQSIINSAYYGTDATHSPLFWDGRVNSLEEQSLKPIATPNEMSGNVWPEEHVLDSIVTRLRTYPLYEAYFAQAFPLEADSIKAGLIGSAITVSTLSRALASFEREINSTNSRFDQFVRGGDTMLTQTEQAGLRVFYGMANCGSCHSGPLLSDSKFYAQGVGQNGPGRDGFAGDDLGRAEQTSNAKDKYAFRTPTLRNVERTAPYMHDGSLKSLEDVVEYYDKGIASHASSFVDSRFHALGLSIEEKTELVAFLKSLTDNSWEDFAVPPASVPSGLRVPH